MPGRVSVINAKNRRSKRLELEADFSVTDKYVQLGTFVGEIYKIECQKGLCHTSYRIWVHLNIGGKWHRLYKSAFTLRYLMDLLEEFEMTPDTIDVSEGLDCSNLIGRAIRAEVRLRIHADGSTSYCIWQIAPLA